MKYRNLGKWGLKVSEVALGSWLTDLSGSAAEQTAAEIVKKRLSLALTFLTAPTLTAAEERKYSSEIY